MIETMVKDQTFQKGNTLKVSFKVGKKFSNFFDDVIQRLVRIEAQLVIIERKEDEHMSQVAQDFEALRVALDDATNAVALKIADLASRIKNSMTDAEVASLKSEFGNVGTRLNDLAASATDPVPDPNGP